MYTDLHFGPDARHIDVAILYGLGQKERAQHLAREMRPGYWGVGTQDTAFSEDEIERVREIISNHHNASTHIQ